MGLRFLITKEISFRRKALLLRWRENFDTDFGRWINLGYRASALENIIKIFTKKFSFASTRILIKRIELLLLILQFQF